MSKDLRFSEEAKLTGKYVVTRAVTHQICFKLLSVLPKLMKHTSGLISEKIKQNMLNLKRSSKNYAQSSLFMMLVK